MTNEIGHLIAGGLLIVSATVAVCLGHIGETAYLSLLGGAVSPVILKAVRTP